MSRTRDLYHANPHQPRPLVQGLVEDPVALDLLTLLSAGPATRNRLATSAARRQALRRLMRLELVSSYRLHGAFYYRLRHVPAFLRVAIDPTSGLTDRAA